MNLFPSLFHTAKEITWKCYNQHNIALFLDYFVSSIKICFNFYSNFIDVFAYLLANKSICEIDSSLMAGQKYKENISIKTPRCLICSSCRFKLPVCLKFIMKERTALFMHPLYFQGNCQFSKNLWRIAFIAR